MSLIPQPVHAVPEETARVAHAIYPKGNIYMRMCDELGTFFCDADFVDLFPDRGQPALAPWRLALVTVMQFVENLSDRQAAEAVRDRISWKYALGLEIADQGFNFSVLSEFRDRLLQSSAEHRLLDLMLVQLKEKGLLKVRGRMRTDATHVLAHMRVMRRLEMVGETLRATLNALAVAAPEWLKAQVTPDWFARYSRRIEDTRFPTSQEGRLALAETYGRDGIHLLQSVYSPNAPAWLRDVPMVETMRQVWLHHFVIIDEKTCWRDAKDTPPSLQQLDSPYETEARYGNKRTVTWIGYRVHLTETCDEELPHLVVNVETSPASPPDHLTTLQIHTSLEAKASLPDEHLVDSGYVTAEHLAECETRFGVDLMGPIHPNTNWQSRNQTGFDGRQFVVDWDREQVTCPVGKVSSRWSTSFDPRGKPVIRVHFSKLDCRPCPQREFCTKSVSKGRCITLRPVAHQQAMERARQRENTDEFKQIYAQRAGVEGTISQSVRRLDLRHCRYRGTAKSHLQHVVTAAAMNILRLDDWLCGVEPAKTRVSHFARLAS
jgi:transposase